MKHYKGISVCLAALLIILNVSSVSSQTVSKDSSDVTTPFKLSKKKPGDLPWASLMRLRKAEGNYRAKKRMRNVYLQLRTQYEALWGNDAAALNYWDMLRSPIDSTGTLPKGLYAVSVVDVINSAADTAQVIMINERHHAPSDRLLTLKLLPVLYKKGFRYLALEALGHKDSTLNQRTYPIKDTGFYTSEPVFAEMIRTALRLGYTLVPYEITEDQRQNETRSMTSQQSRDHAQALNLYNKIFKQHPKAKVLVHAGFGHIEEKPQKNWVPMAYYFQKISDINPLTVDQTKMSERSEPRYELPDYRAAITSGLLNKKPIILFDSTGQPFNPTRFSADLLVFSPRTTYTNGRPDWMRLAEHRVSVKFSVPECLNRLCFIKVMDPSEPPQAAALDRTDIKSKKVVRLFLPPQQPVKIQVFTKNAQLLDTINYKTN